MARTQLQLNFTADSAPGYRPSQLKHLVRRSKPTETFVQLSQKAMFADGTMHSRETAKYILQPLSGLPRLAGALNGKGTENKKLKLRETETKELMKESWRNEGLGSFSGCKKHSKGPETEIFKVRLLKTLSPPGKANKEDYISQLMGKYSEALGGSKERPHKGYKVGAGSDKGKLLRQLKKSKRCSETVTSRQLAAFVGLFPLQTQQPTVEPLPEPEPQREEVDIGLIQSKLALGLMAEVLRVQASPRPNTIIVIRHVCDTYHDSHTINVASTLINAFISFVFRSPQLAVRNVSFTVSLARVLGVSLSAGQVNAVALGDRAFRAHAKERLLRFLYAVINAENGLNVERTSQSFYKGYIGGGNNAMLVRSVLKQRWWWCCVQKREIETANFIWTQWRRDAVYSILAKKPGEDEGEGLSGAYSTVYLCKETAAGDSDCEGKKGTRGTAPRRSLLAGALRRQASKEAVGNNSIDDISSYSTHKLYNHLEQNFQLTNKKGMFYNLKRFYESQKLNPFDCIPLTFHIRDTDSDPQYQKFLAAYSSAPTSANIWIIKPGENTNRGEGIRIARELQEIQQILKEMCEKHHTAILQKYMENPLLINKRKFDIRCYALITSVNKKLKAYFYQEGYLRTSAAEFTLKSLENKFAHLTNDAVQIKSDDYGKYEPGNKLSFEEFQRYLDENYPDLHIDFRRDLFSQIRSLVTDSIRAACDKLDPNRRCHCSEIMGYDFMIDDKFNVYLIEINTNPCLEVTSPLLSRIIPAFLDDTFRYIGNC